MNYRPSGTSLTGLILFLGILSWLVLSMSVVLAQPTTLRLTAGSLTNKPDGLALHRQPLRWRFHPGDNRAWADTNLDDRQWAIAPSEFYLNKPIPGWRGLGWFRLRLIVDNTLVGKPLALRFWHMGASEIYLDGRLISKFGTIGHSKRQESPFLPFHQPVPFLLGDTKPHLIAVRYSDLNKFAPLRPSGFAIWIGGRDQISRSILSFVRQDRFSLFLVGVCSTLALLHFFLFLFYPKQKLNLYYSLSIGFYALLVISGYVRLEMTEPALWYKWELVTYVSNVLSFGSLIMLLYSFGYVLIAPWRIGVLALGCTYFLLIYLFFPKNIVPFSFTLFFILGMLDGLWAIRQAVRRRQPGAWLVGVGMLVAALLYVFVVTDVLGLWREATNKQVINWVSFLPLPLCFSLYLALNFARTNRNLKAQLDLVQSLSAKTLAQEAEKLKLVAEQNEVLEKTVQERTEKIQQQADKLREVDAIKSRFFTNLAHEFRTPLTLMLGPAEQVLAETGEPKTIQQVGLLHRNAQRLLQLINQLLDLSKLEAGKTQLILSSQDMIGLVKGTLLSFESLAHQKEIALRVTADRDKLIMFIDCDKLEKILYNLFSNALKFTQSGGEVLVSLTQEAVGEEPWAKLVVGDTGVGIPAAKLPYVFDQFYQVDASNTREQAGFGIGLALTKELVELHDGRIHIDSQEGVGTTITVRLPIRQEYPVGHEPVDDKIESGLPTSYRGVADPVQDSLPQLPEGADAAELLLIEDNDEVRQFIRSSLGHQYRIIEAMNGEEGVRLAQEHVPDLVITDLMMPKLDGNQVCVALKQDERTSHIPLVMLTAKADLDSRIHGLQTGADSYLAKPFHQRELLAQIANLIASRRQLRERFSRDNVWHTRDALPSIEQAFLDRIRTAINARLDDESFNVDQLSDDMGVSRTQLHRKLKALVNQSPGDLIRVARLQRALDLLTRNVATVSEVAYMVGFGNPANFSTSFSRHFGYAPSEVKKKVGSAAS